MSEKRLTDVWLREQLNDVTKELNSWPEWMKDQARALDARAAGGQTYEDKSHKVEKD